MLVNWDPHQDNLNTNLLSDQKSEAVVRHLTSRSLSPALNKSQGNSVSTRLGISVSYCKLFSYSMITTKNNATGKTCYYLLNNSFFIRALFKLALLNWTPCLNIDLNRIKINK